MPKNGNKKHLPHLTGFRAIAAYLVLIAHSLQTTFKYGSIRYAENYISCLAYLGMSIFFVLSGFVITYTYYDRFIKLSWWQAAREFTIARFARLYPLYIIIILGDRDCFKPLVRQGTIYDWVSYLTLTQSWWNMQMLSFPPAWSISTECFFYLCFVAWMCPWIVRHSDKYNGRTATMTLAFVLLTLLTAYAGKADITMFLCHLVNHASEHNVWYWFKYFSPYVRIGEFIAGACAARMFVTTQYEEPQAADQRRANLLCAISCLAVILLTVGTYCGYVLGNDAGWFAPDGFPFFLCHNFGYAPFLAYIFYTCTKYPNLIARWCSTRMMQAGGEISYSIYMLQFWIYYHVLWDQVAGVPSFFAYEISILKAIFYVLFITLISFCSYRLIEVPSRRLLRWWLN